MALDHNDQRAQNFTSGAILNRNLSKVVIPTGKNSELLESVRDIIEAGVKDIYGDPTQKKYQKIVNLIIKRVAAQLEDSSVSTNVKSLSNNVTKDLNQLKKELLKLDEEAAKSKKASTTSNSNSSSIDSLFKKINEQIVSFREEQQQQLNELKEQIKQSTKKTDKKTEKKVEPKAEKKEPKADNAQKSQTTSNKEANKPKEAEKESEDSISSMIEKIASEVSLAVNDLKNHIEFALSQMSTKFDAINSMIITSFQNFDANFQQISTQLNSSFQQNTRGFENVNDSIKQMSQDILEQIQSLNKAGNGAASSISSVNEEIAHLLKDIIETSTEGIVEKLVDATATAITPLISFQADKIFAASEKNAVDVKVHVDDRIQTVLAAVNKSTKLQKIATEENRTKVSGLSQFLGRMRQSVERRVTSLGSFIGRLGKRQTKTIEKSQEGIFKRVMKKISGFFRILLIPVKFLVGGIFKMMSFIFKPLTWLFGFLKGPALLLFLVGALVFLWPHISEYITGWWNEYIGPAFKWVIEQLKNLWEVVSTAVSDWWTEKWAGYGGFGNYVQFVLFPKVEKFFTETLWPFVTERIWPFIKDHWQSILITIGIFSFLKNPMGVLKLALSVPILILRSIQAVIATIRIIAMATKVITMITHGLVAAMPAIISALPIILVGLLVAAIVGAFAWFTSDSYEELCDTAAQEAAARKKKIEINHAEEVKDWFKKNWEERLTDTLSRVGKIDSRTERLLAAQKLKVIQSQKFYTGNNETIKGSQIKDLVSKTFTEQNLNSNTPEDGNLITLQGDKKYTFQGAAEIVANSGAEALLKDSIRNSAGAGGENLPEGWRKEYKKIIGSLQKYLLLQNEWFGMVENNARLYVEDIQNWGSDPELGKRLKKFVDGWGEFKNQATQDLINKANGLFYVIDNEKYRWYWSNKKWKSLSIQASKFDSALYDMYMENVDCARDKLQALMSGGQHRWDNEFRVDDLRSKFMDMAFKLNERQHFALGQESAAETTRLIKDWYQSNSTQGSWLSANGYASFDYVTKRTERLEKLQNDAIAGIFAAENEIQRAYYTRGDDSVDDKYIEMLRNVLVGVGMSGGREGNLSNVDQIKAYYSVIAQMRDEFSTTQDEERKKRLGELERALRNQLDKYREAERKKTGKDAFKDIIMDLRKQQWDKMSPEERQSWKSFDEFVQDYETASAEHFRAIGYTSVNFNAKDGSVNGVVSPQ